MSGAHLFSAIEVEEVFFSRPSPGICSERIENCLRPDFWIVELVLQLVVVAMVFQKQVTVRVEEERWPRIMFDCRKSCRKNCPSGEKWEATV